MESQEVSTGGIQNEAGKLNFASIRVRLGCRLAGEMTLKAGRDIDGSRAIPHWNLQSHVAMFELKVSFCLTRIIPKQFRLYLIIRLLDGMQLAQEMPAT